MDCDWRRRAKAVMAAAVEVEAASGGGRSIERKERIRALKIRQSKNRGNPPNYYVNRVDPIEWTSMILSSHDDLSEQYLPHFNFDFDFDYHEGDNMDVQKEEDAMEYFKTRIHHVVLCLKME
ncbi:hypothetical protein H5410_052085 [Solanum commersonii]|uniref:Uncharacterized protein n=1 Tax=Solanum commersonii TaxID=4109 RepID=A0A9J5X0E6_SOLCO|nr:hypothetical protein H5410_052085 [Solanum commersonii]